MGDRANFGFVQNGHILYLYGHWAGEGMLSTLANALDKARPCWNDTAYGTRIAVSQIVGDDWSGELGWGLSIDSLCDNQHKIPVVNFEKGRVTLYKEGRTTLNGVTQPLGDPIFSMDLDTFVKRYKK